MNSDCIRIATRSSKLALWQAEEVKSQLEAHGHRCELILIESTGDLQLTQPIYAMGISGVFTKQLDIALLEGKADIAVHSLKDVPTALAEGLTLTAVLPRGAHQDVIIVKDKSILNTDITATIATSSLRRIAQWRSKYPNHNTVPIRGNVQTRMNKFHADENMSGVIFAKAGLERVGLLPDDAVILDWMIPAPAQGIVGIICSTDDTEISAICAQINHEASFTAGSIERQFLKTLMGGCSVPISAYCFIDSDGIHFKGAMHSFDGAEHYTVTKTFSPTEADEAGRIAAHELLAVHGAAKLLEQIRNKNWSHEDTID